MSARSWMRFPVADFFSWTLGMSAEEIGVFVRLVGAYWINRGPLPADDEALACAAMVDADTWTRVKPAVAELFTVSEGAWSASWIDDELAAPGWAVPFPKSTGEPDPRHGAEWRALRIAVFHRDDFTCVYCGTKGGALECDHVLPVSRGGTNAMENLATACKPCNRDKRDHTLDEWRPT